MVYPMATRPGWRRKTGQHGLCLGSMIVAAILMLGIASPAHAVPISLEFTVSDIPPSFAGVPAPTNPVSGVIVFEAAGLGSTIDSLISISLDVGGHSFTLDETSFMSPFGIGPADVIFGSINGTGVTTATSDFLLQYDREAATGIVFRYASSDVVGIWSGDNFSSFDLVAVPEPSRFGLLALGLTGILIARRKPLP